MKQSSETKDTVSLMIERLLSGPARPGQAFSMPGCNYDGLYRTARQIKAFFDSDNNDRAPVCLCSDDRAVMAAALLASLAGGPELMMPHSLSATAILELHHLTDFTRTIGNPGARLPAGVTAIDPEVLTDEVETLASDAGLNPDRPWVRLFTDESTGSPRLWSKTPRNLLGEVDYLVKRFEIGSNDRILASVSALTLYGLLYSLLVPLAASARVVAGTPSFPEAIKQQMTDTVPTIFVSVPVHYRALRETPLDKGALRLAFSSAGSLADVDDTAFSKATGVDLVEVYGTTETGGIATRSRAKGEPHLTPYHCIQWRVAGASLDIRSSFLSQELPIRSSGWFTVADPVKAHGSEGFVVTEQATEAITASQQVKFEPAGLNVSSGEEKTLQEMGANHGIDIRADCGGMGVCGKCRVLVRPKENFSPPTDAELDVLTPGQMADGSRLACQARAIGKGTVTIPDTLAESSETRGKTGIAGSYPVDPMTRRLTVDGRSPGLKTDNTPESLVDWLAVQIGDPAASTADIASLRRLGRYRDSLKTFTVVVHEETGIRRILEGKQTASLGFAVDLGTTSVAGYLCDLKTGTLLAADACINPQWRFGEDVISRISRINEKDEHLDQLQHLAAEGINFLMTRCLEQIGATTADIDEVAVCGNTTMEQVFAGLHPYGLGVFPYFPLTLTPPVFSAGDLGLTTDPAVPVLLMPVISGFVGGDTMAAILADRPHERDEITLIVDIGTNGEVVLGNRNGLWVTSCATGPALEGAQISCGMRAVSGAIHRVWPDESNSRVAYDVLTAKGALFTGIEFLMRKAGIDKIDRTILTGAFGARFNWKNALAIGMLPPVVAEGEVIPKENLAGVGVVMALLDKKLRSEARTLCRHIRYLELASEPEFAMAFARATAFPELQR